MRVEGKRTERRGQVNPGGTGELGWPAVAESRVNRRKGALGPIGDSYGDTRTHMGTRHWRRGGSVSSSKNTAPGAGSSIPSRAISGQQGTCIKEALSQSSQGGGFYGARWISFSLPLPTRQQYDSQPTFSHLISQPRQTLKNWQHFPNSPIRQTKKRCTSIRSKNERTNKRQRGETTEERGVVVLTIIIHASMHIRVFLRPL